VAVDASGLEEFVQIVYQEGVVHWSSQLDVADMAWAEVAVQSASHASMEEVLRSKY
jgi:hypothetical protein